MKLLLFVWVLITSLLTAKLLFNGVFAGATFFGASPTTDQMLDQFRYLFLAACTASACFLGIWYVRRTKVWLTVGIAAFVLLSAGSLAALAAA